RGAGGVIEVFGGGTSSDTFTGANWILNASGVAGGRVFLNGNGLIASTGTINASGTTAGGGAIVVSSTGSMNLGGTVNAGTTLGGIAGSIYLSSHDGSVTVTNGLSAH